MRHIGYYGNAIAFADDQDLGGGVRGSFVFSLQGMIRFTPFRSNRQPQLPDRSGAITKQRHDHYEYHPPNCPGGYCQCHRITTNLILAVRQMLATTAEQPGC